MVTGKLKMSLHMCLLEQGALGALQEFNALQCGGFLATAPGDHSTFLTCADLQFHPWDPLTALWSWWWRGWMLKKCIVRTGVRYTHNKLT